MATTFAKTTTIKTLIPSPTTKTTTITITFTTITTTTSFHDNDGDDDYKQCRKTKMQIVHKKMFIQ